MRSHPLSGVVLVLSACSATQNPSFVEDAAVEPGKQDGSDAATDAPDDTTTAETTYTFMQLADTQLGRWCGNDDFEVDAEQFRRAIVEANTRKPAFVVVCGDLINEVMSSDQKDEFKRIAAMLDPAIPMKLVAGNHDVGNAPTATTLAWYREQFGPDWYAFDHGPDHFIVLDSSLIKDGSDAPASEVSAQKAWLEAELTSHESSARYLFVLQHHAWFLEQRDESDDYFNMGDARGEYLPLLEGHHVRAVFAGHYHRNAYATAMGIEHITTSSVGKPSGDGESGFRMITVKPDVLEIPFETLPAAQSCN
jgi:serine/threonine-protein phosphatase CPPED1